VNTDNSSPSEDSRILCDDKKDLEENIDTLNLSNIQSYPVMTSEKTLDNDTSKSKFKTQQKDP